MKINKYPDGSSYIVDKYCDNSKSRVFKVNNYEDLWHLNQFVDVSNHNGIIPDIIIPNLIDAQADRRFNEFESSGLKLVCKFLNNMKATFKIFHPHNPEVVEALIDNVEIIDNFEFINEVSLKIGSIHLKENKITQQNKLENNLTLMSTDAGGFKPLMKLTDQLNWEGETFSASKSRKWKDGKSELTQEVNTFDFEGKDILIIDDLCVFGGTFKGLAKILDSKGIGKLYLAVSHMTVQNLKGDDPITNYFDTIFTTNSKFNQYYIENDKGEPIIPNNLKVINLF